MTSKDALLVLRDQREEASGITFDVALERFLDRLQRVLTFSGLKDVRVEFKRVPEIDIIFVSYSCKSNDLVNPTGAIAFLNYCIIDEMSGSIQSYSQEMDPDELTGHIFEPDWFEQWARTKPYMVFDGERIFTVPEGFEMSSLGDILNQVLRDSREEQAGITFDAALKRFKAGLYHLIRTRATTSTYTWKNLSIGISRYFKYHLVTYRGHDLFRGERRYTYAYIDNETGDILSGRSNPYRTSSIYGHVFQPHWFETYGAEEDFGLSYGHLRIVPREVSRK